MLDLLKKISPGSHKKPGEETNREMLKGGKGK